MALTARVLTIDRDGKLCRYEPSGLGPGYKTICIENETAGGFHFSKDAWHTGRHEHVVLVPNAEADPSDSDWHAYRWGVGARYAYSYDLRFAEALTTLLGKPWPKGAAVHLADVIEKVM